MLKVVALLTIISLLQGLPRHKASPVEFAGQFDSPWFALIFVKGSERCGGSLIHDKYVLTAAHCLDNREGPFASLDLHNVKVFLGEWKLNQDPDCSEKVETESCELVAKIPPKKIYIHENYDKEAGNDRFQFDIALIKLRRAPRLNGIIDYIKLPSPDLCSSDFAGTSMKFTGFGETSTKRYADRKKKIQFNILNATVCKSGLGSRFFETTQFCGNGVGGLSSCKGDGGSGLIRVEWDTPVLQGITTYVSAECGRSTFSVFLKVSCFVDWIDEKIFGKRMVIETTTSTTARTFTESISENLDYSFDY